jgi:16S rRNA (guanine(966)-N(2))-methyltransferase RsmD
LRCAPGLAIRPTSDRLRESLFNILASRIVGARFLDICAGSGAVGIEALSRGADHATFIERSRRASAIIEANLASLGITSEARVINRDATSAMKRLIELSEKFDIAFFDPPYSAHIYRSVMTLLAAVLASSGIAIIEHHAKSPPEPEYGPLRIYREIRHGESALAFYASL